jgi:neutral trehalase
MIKCKMGKAVEEINDSFHEALLESFLEDRYKTSSYAIMRGMREAGFDVSERTIDRHRTQKCVCVGGN